MRYVNARLEEERREEAYRIYVTKSLQLIPQNKCLTKDYEDFINPKKIDNRSGEEIATDIIKRANLHFRGLNNECI